MRIFKSICKLFRFSKYKNYISSFKENRKKSLYEKIFLLIFFFFGLTFLKIYKSNLSILISIFAIGFYYFLTSTILIIFTGITNHIYRKNNKLKNNFDDNFTLGLNLLSKLILLFTFIFLFFKYGGIILKALLLLYPLFLLDFYGLFPSL